MKLDLVIPTYRRSGLLRAAVSSALRAPVPAGLEVRILVVDNNSGDDTAATVRELQKGAAFPIEYFCETTQGSSQARNRGIREGSGDLIGFIDDDEELDPEWFGVVAREFANPDVAYIGGPYLGNWVTARPDWLPPGYPAVIGVVPPKPRSPFGTKLGANLMGGNAVIRRCVFDRVGLYAEHLGRSGKGLLSEEDAEFFTRLMAAHVPGVYVPELLIYHYIAPERLTRGYHRRWAFWRTVSQGLRSRKDPEPFPQVLGIPRYRIGRALRSLFRWPLVRFGKGGKAHAFANELAVLDLAGFAYGRYFFRPASYYTSTQAVPADRADAR